MSFTSSRKTYDTDSIVLRRIFAYDISNNTPFSTGFVLTSLTKGVATFQSPLDSLSTFGWYQLPAEISTLQGELLSTIVTFPPNYPSSQEVFLPSTVIGLGTSGYVSSLSLNSTIAGLGSAGYISSFIISDAITSSIVGLGTVNYVSSTQLASTVAGLSQAGYISSSQLTSSLNGLGQIGYLSTANITSTLNSVLTSSIEGLATSGYISTLQLTSSIVGLGSAGYLSTQFSIYRSTYPNTSAYAPNYSNVAYLFSNVSTGVILSTLSFDLGASLREKINPTQSKLDIEVKPNLQFSYYDATSRDYQFNTLLVRGKNFAESNVIGRECLSYYILNANPINLPYFFQEKNRFLISDQSFLTSLKNDAAYSTLTLFHTFGPRVPSLNQFFVTPASTVCASVVLDNIPSL